MEPSKTESNQTSSALESEHGITTYGDLRTRPATGIDGVHISASGKKLSSFSFTSCSSSSSSSSSPDSPFGDPFQEDEVEHYETTPSTTAPHKLDENAHLVSKYGEKDVSGSPVPKLEQSNHELRVSTLPPAVTSDTPELSLNNVSATDSPPIQVMEQSGDVSGSPVPKLEQSNHELPVSTLPPAVTSDTPGLRLNNVSATDSPPIQVMERSGDSSYRIPSSVFTRTKSSAPVEWSIASNDSLFSIHTGHMSFHKDAVFWRSGELGMPGDASTSSRFFNFSPNDPPVHEATNTENSNERISVAQASVETMREVLREIAEDQTSAKVSIAPSTSCHSTGSGASVKSFAFPILTGDLEKGRSVKMNQSVKVGPERPQLQPEPPPEPEPEPEPKTPAATPNTARTSWFSCFSCCSSCS